MGSPPQDLEDLLGGDQCTNGSALETVKNIDVFVRLSLIVLFISTLILFFAGVYLRTVFDSYVQHNTLPPANANDAVIRGEY